MPGDQRISFDEFCLLVHREDVSDVSDRNSQRDIVEAFQKFDPADTGFVKVSHLKKVLSEVGERLTDDQVDAFVRCADPNGDGHIDYISKYCIDGDDVGLLAEIHGNVCMILVMTISVRGELCPV